MESYDEIVTYIMKNILGKYFLKDCENVCQPIVVGGSVISHICLKQSALSICDVDIVYIPKNKTKAALVATNKVRETFLFNILKDPQLLDFINKKQKENNGIPYLNLNIDYLYKRKPEYKRIAAIKLVRLCVDKKVLVDTSIQHSGINKIFGKYPVKGITRTTPTPYVKRRGILWATCEYMKIDTMRIILHYNNAINTEEDNQVLSLARYLKYLKKIYMLLKLSDPIIEDLFNNVANTTSNADNMNTLFNQLNSHAKFYKLKAKLLKAIPNAHEEVINI